MKIFVLAKPKSKIEEIKKVDNNRFIVKTKELEIEGRANQAILKAVADYFSVEKCEVRIITGHA